MGRGRKRDRRRLLCLAVVLQEDPSRFCVDVSTEVRVALVLLPSESELLLQVVSIMVGTASGTAADDAKEKLVEFSGMGATVDESMLAVCCFRKDPFRLLNDLGRQSFKKDDDRLFCSLVTK